MAINALIAQGLRPIGADVPQIGNMLNEKRQMDTRNALAQRSMAIDETNSQNYQNSLRMQQEAAAQRGQESQMEAIRQQAGSVLDNLQSIAGTPDYGLAVSKLQANPRVAEVARAFGIDVADLADPKNLPVARSLVGLEAPKPAYRVTQEKGPNGATILTDGSRFQVVEPPKPDAGAANKWQKIEQTMPDGRVQTGFVDMSAPDPSKTFRPLGEPAKTGGGMKEATTLRKEFDALPAVKDYRQVITLYQRAANAPNTRAGDLSIVYALGKIFDPGSVVREGELQLAQNAAPWLKKIVGQAQSQIKGTGGLLPGVRAELLDAMKGQVTSVGEQYAQTRSQYDEYAKNYGIDPSLVIGKDPTPAAPATGGERKTVGGKTYVKDGDQWYEETP